MWQGKPRLAVASNQTKSSVVAIFNVSMSAEKWLLTGYLLKLAANCAILSNQKLRCGTLFLHKTKMKQRILQVCSLKNSIKQGIFSVVGKMNLFGSGRGSPPPTSPPPPLATRLHVITLYSQKVGYTVLQRQWPLNLVEFWVRVKGFHLLLQVTCRSDYVLFEKHHVCANAR